jgi:Domain of unknown function (DUF4407)
MNHYVKRFLLFCSGSEPSILDRPECVTERNKYAAIGATILSTAALAALSGGYAVHTVFESAPASVCLGLVWALIIFNLDRYIVSTLRKKAAPPGASWRERLTAWGQELGHALPRMLLACFISVIITRPLELRLFEREIETRMDAANSELLAGMVRQKDAEFPDLDRLAEENRRLLGEVDVKEEETQALHEAAMEEAIGKEGPGRTGRVGKGVIFAERWAAFRKAEAELNTLKQQNGEKVAANERRMAEMRGVKDQGVEELRGGVGNRRGLLARLEAHSHLAAHNPAVAWASRFLILLFILLETAPLVAKLLSKRGPYDEIQDAWEHRVYVRERKGISDLNDEANTDVSLSRQQNAGRVAAELELTRSTMASLETLASEELREARMEIARLEVELWKQAELAALRRRGRAQARAGANGFKAGPAPAPPPAYAGAAAPPAADTKPPAAG